MPAGSATHPRCLPFFNYRNDIVGWGYVLVVLALFPLACRYVKSSIPFHQRRNGSIRGHCALADPQRNGGAEDVIGIIVPLGFGEPFGIATIVFQHTACVAQPRRFGYPPGTVIASKP